MTRLRGNAHLVYWMLFSNDQLDIDCQYWNRIMEDIPCHALHELHHTSQFFKNQLNVFYGNSFHFLTLAYQVWIRDPNIRYKYGITCPYLTLKKYDNSYLRIAISICLPTKMGTKTKWNWLTGAELSRMSKGVYDLFCVRDTTSSLRTYSQATRDHEQFWISARENTWCVYHLRDLRGYTTYNGPVLRASVNTNCVQWHAVWKSNRVSS